MADRIPSQYFTDHLYASNINHQRSIIPEPGSSNYSYRSVHRPSSQTNDLMYGISQAGTTYFNSSGQISTPYFSSSSNERYGSFRSGSVSLLSTTNNLNDSGISSVLQDGDLNNTNWSFNSSKSIVGHSEKSMKETDGPVTLQLSNLDSTCDHASLKKYLTYKLQSITPIISFTFEGVMAKICLPSLDHAKQVVSYLHRKKVGHKRITVSYTKDCTSMDPSTLRCQVAGLLKDIPYYRLSMYKFRELFQSRFKTSISVSNLCEMSDICNITEIANEKFVSLRSELIHSIERGELNDCFLQSVPYCGTHFKKGHRGWAEQEIEPLPNVWMSVAEVRSIMYALTQQHPGNIPVASLLHCIQGELKYNIISDEKGVNLEHLLSCVNEIQISTNKFGIKILNWVDNEPDNDLSEEFGNFKGSHSKNFNIADAYGQFSTEVFDLLVMCPKSTMKFARFIPTYHNTFKRQCRVADYGFVKLIDLFEAVPLIIQVLGEGENRQITLTHQRQMRRLATDLQKVLRNGPNKSIRLSHVPLFLSANQKMFEITDYGICNIKDAVEELRKTNLITVEPLPNFDDMMLSLPKRRQSNAELRKTSVFAYETIELLKIAPQYTIAYEKFSCSYHYHFTYQLRLNDYGHTKLADMMEGLTGIVKIELFNDDDRKIYLAPKVAQRVFSEQLRNITETITGKSFTFINVENVLAVHKKTFGYQMKPETLGFDNLLNAIRSLPFIELIVQNDEKYIVCHHHDDNYKFRSHIVILLLDSMLRKSAKKYVPINQLINTYFEQFEEEMNECLIESMNHFIDIFIENNVRTVSLSKVAVFLLSIVKTLKSVRSITISQLNIESSRTNVCFQIGYPDLKTLIESFSDIFTVHDPLASSANEWSDRCEITLNKRSIFSKEEFDSNGNLFKKPLLLAPKKATAADLTELENTKNTNSSLANDRRVPFGEIPKNSMSYQQVKKNSEVPFKFMRSNNNEMIPNNSLTVLKENVHYSANDNQANVQENNLKLHQRRTLKRTYDQLSCTELDSIEEIINNKKSTEQLLAMYLAPPKPDTPANTTSPSLVDPIWNASPKRSPSNDTNAVVVFVHLNIPIPELKTFPHAPKLDTPTMMNRLARSGNFQLNSPINK